jgi:bacterioferritin-associated ferredoxin
MYICICNAIKEKQLNSAISQGAASVCETFQKLGCKPMCGKCVPDIRESLSQCDALQISQ